MQSLAEPTEKAIKIDEYPLDLTWFHLSGEMNSIFSKRCTPMRFTCLDVTPNVMSISRNSHVVALYLRDVNRLYRIEGSLLLQWMMIKNAFEKFFEGITVIG
jgi:hypothetical protein